MLSHNMSKETGGALSSVIKNTTNIQEVWKLLLLESIADQSP